MLKLILSRLLQSIFVLLIVSVLTFALLASAGGDAITGLRNDPLVTEEMVRALRQVYGLDQPLLVRYARWLGGIVRGDLGQSFYYHAPVARILWSRLWHTVALATVALTFAWSIALTLGALAARRPRGWASRLSGVVILFGSSTPRIVLALAALAFTARTSLFSMNSNATAETGAGLWVRLLLPALVLSVPLIALFVAQVREGLGVALREEFVQVARAKGEQVGPGLILDKHG